VKFCITGSDACGKATQAKILAERLGAALFSFPNYESPTGKAILGNLRGSWEIHRDSNADHHEGCYKVPEVNALVLQALMNANRVESTAALKAAERKGHVVCDRYDVDALVYGALDGLDADWLEMLNDNLPFKPDVYILLDVPVEEGFKRRPQRRDRYEADVKRMEQVRAAYLELFRSRENEGNWRVVDGIGSIDDVSARVWTATGLKVRA